MVDHIFREPEVGYIAHTSFSLALRKDEYGVPVASSYYINLVENHIEAVPKYVECIEKVSCSKQGSGACTVLMCASMEMRLRRARMLLGHLGMGCRS